MRPGRHLSWSNFKASTFVRGEQRVHRVSNSPIIEIFGWPSFTTRRFEKLERFRSGLQVKRSRGIAKTRCGADKEAWQTFSHGQSDPMSCRAFARAEIATRNCGWSQSFENITFPAGGEMVACLANQILFFRARSSPCLSMGVLASTSRMQICLHA
jgi:hypothetical protein